MSPLPSSRSAPISSSTTRESLRLATWNAIRAGRLPLISPVTTSTVGLLGRQDQVDADGAGELGQPDDVLLDLLLRGHHHLGQLVDDDHDVRHVGRDALPLLVVLGGEPRVDLLGAQLVVGR